jgi:hypothetical protein
MFRHRSLPLACVALIGAYLGERVLAGPGRVILDAGAILLGAAAVAAVIARERSADPDRRRANRWILIGYGVSALGVVLYALPFSGGGWGTLLPAVWPMVLALGFLPAAAMEMALRRMAHPPGIQLGRVALAGRGALILVLAILTKVGIDYASVRWGRQIDLSYFRTTQLGDATRARVQGLDRPLQVHLFFPPGNDVLAEVERYTAELARASKQVVVRLVDQAVEPALSRRLGVRSNGYLGFESGGRFEVIKLGLGLYEARPILRRLDARVNEKLARVLQPERTIYLTTGHGEPEPAPSEDRPGGLLEFKKLAGSLAMSVRPLGLAEGLSRAVPEDAALVVVAGPEKSFLPEETAAVERYWDGGGRLLLLLDPGGAALNQKLLGLVGLEESQVMVAHDHHRIRLRGSGESPTNVVTTQVRHHPSTATLTRASRPPPVVLLGAGSLSVRPGASEDLRQTFTLLAMPGSYLASQRDLRQETDPSERFNFAAAVERGRSRAVVVADAEIVCAEALRNNGNVYFATDALRWLTGEEALAGTIQSEEDVAIVHRKERDVVWFYGVSFIVPATTLVGGLAFARRRARRRREDA